MIKLNHQFERFETKTTKEFKNDNFYIKVEEVKDTILKKTWYNVIWSHTPTINIIPKDLLKYMYIIKSKSYKNEKDAIKHFNNIIKSKLK